MFLMPEIGFEYPTSSVYPGSWSGGHLVSFNELAICSDFSSPAEQPYSILSSFLKLLVPFTFENGHHCILIQS
jgi:hypothetical protein